MSYVVLISVIYSKCHATDNVTSTLSEDGKFPRLIYPFDTFILHPKADGMRNLTVTLKLKLKFKLKLIYSPPGPCSRLRFLPYIKIAQ